MAADALSRLHASQTDNDGFDDDLPVYETTHSDDNLDKRDRNEKKLLKFQKFVTVQRDDVPCPYQVETVSAFSAAPFCMTNSVLFQNDHD